MYFGVRKYALTTRTATATLIVLAGITLTTKFALIPCNMRHFSLLLLTNRGCFQSLRAQRFVLQQLAYRVPVYLCQNYFAILVWLPHLPAAAVNTGKLLQQTDSLRCHGIQFCRPHQACGAAAQSAGLFTVD
jgi:hypothetical protein